MVLTRYLLAQARLDWRTPFPHNLYRSTVFDEKVQMPVCVCAHTHCTPHHVLHQIIVHQIIDYIQATRNV